MVKAKKFILAHHFDGAPRSDNFELQEEELPALKEGEFLAEGLFFSVDPYMRPYSVSLVNEGTLMIGSQVAKVIESKNSEYEVGTLVIGYFGWRNLTVVDPKVVPTAMRNYMFKLPDIGGLSPSLGLGALGMPGNTAYFGFLEICQPKPGDVVVVSGAAGAVGSLVGQIAKIKGCHVIGFAGEDDKVKWLVEELGFDKAYNYKTVDVDKCLKEAAPEGIDCYFDNVGGLFSSTVRGHMKDFGRISVCGAISVYNDKPSNPTMIPSVEPNLLFKQVKMEGFLVHRWMDRWEEGIGAMAKWMMEGKIKIRETFTEGFEKMPEAFMGMMTGKNTGKALIKA